MPLRSGIRVSARLDAKVRQRQNETNRAESALRPAFVDHRFLNRRKRAVRRVDALDRYDMLPGSVSERHQAGRHRAVPHLIFYQLADHDRACSAIALAAADLRPFQILPVTNEVKQRHAGRQIGGNILIVKYELQHPLITYNFSLLTYCDGDLQK